MCLNLIFSFPLNAYNFCCYYINLVFTLTEQSTIRLWPVTVILLYFHRFISRLSLLVFNYLSFVLHLLYYYTTTYYTILYLWFWGVFSIYKRHGGAQVFEWSPQSTHPKPPDLELPIYTAGQILFIENIYSKFYLLFNFQIGLHIQFWHHIGCSVAVGLIFWDMNNQGEQYFTQLKFCMQTILFHVYTQCMIPVLTCKSVACYLF